MENRQKPNLPLSRLPLPPKGKQNAFAGRYSGLASTRRLTFPSAMRPVAGACVMHAGRQTNDSRHYSSGGCTGFAPVSLFRRPIRIRRPSEAPGRSISRPAASNRPGIRKRIPARFSPRAGAISRPARTVWTAGPHRAADLQKYKYYFTGICPSRQAKSAPAVCMLGT